jgi:hypothetical protein
MSAETIAILAPYLAGPGAAVLVLLFVIAGAGFIFVKFLIPMGMTFGNRHLEQIDALIKNQQEEAKTIAKALSSLDRRLAVIESQIIAKDDGPKA